MTHRRGRLAAPCGAAFLLLALSGCHPQQPSVPPSNSVPPPPPPTASEPFAVKTPVKDAVQQMLAQQQARPDSVIPQGTRLLSVNLKDGVATLDFSKEFGKLADMGETTEGQAQKLILKTLAPISTVDKVTVTVEGKPFVGQTDWDRLDVRIQDGVETQRRGSSQEGDGR
ncbi:MAG TPA: GerMN domain-containing protein [Chthonomonadaceae bacterium]|nr:GerMN domain-containing protein [Chthonomonadaceae bacterium]